MASRSAVPFWSLLSPLLLGLTLTLLISCKPASWVSGESSANQSHETPPPPLPPRRQAIWKDFDSERSLSAAQAILGFGNRIAGRTALDPVRGYLKSNLVAAGWEVTE